MSDREKIEAFDLIAAAFTGRIYDGRWRWACLSPGGGGGFFTTRREAVADLVAYARKVAGHKDRIYVTRIHLPVLGQQ